MDEEKKVFKISLKTLMFLIIIIVLLVVIIVMGFMLASKSHNEKQSESAVSKDNEDKEEVVSNIVENEVENKTDNKVKNKVSNKTKNTVNPDSSGNVQYVEKIVDAKSYIYDAQYSVENLKIEEYQTNDGTSHSASDIVVPFVNMVSDDADDVNNEIQSLYENYMNEYKVCSENKNSFIKVNYETFTTANIISVLITVQRGNENEETNEYVTYNFDAIDGVKLTYSQTYELVGIKDIEEKVKNVISNLEDFEEYELNESYPEEVREARDKELEDCKNKIYTYYQQDLLNNHIAYYLDRNLKFNIAINVVLPAEGGEYSKIVVVE